MNGLMPDPSYRRELFSASILLGSLLAILLLAMFLPSIPGTKGIASYVPLHSLLEMLAIGMAMLIVAVGWDAQRPQLPANVVILSSAFAGVALLDFSHTISYSGMSDFVTPSGAEKAIYFWLSARLLAALALLLVALRPWREGLGARSRNLLWLVVLLACLPIHGFVLFRPDWLPTVFVAGEGLTPFKIYSEYLIIGLYLAAALLFWRRMAAPQVFNAPALFIAVSIMAMSEFFFTLYADVTDIYNLLGHLYKVLAYYFLYRALFVEMVTRPYAELHSSQQRLESILGAIPDMLFELDRQGRVYACHAGMNRDSVLSCAELADRRLDQILPAEVVASLERGLEEADSQGFGRGRFALDSAQGSRHFAFTLAKNSRTGAGQPARFIVLCRDITEIKAYEDELQLLAHRAQALLELPHTARHVEGTEFLQHALEMAEELTGSQISFAHFIDEDQEHIELITWSKRTLEHYCHAVHERHYPVSQAGIWADALRIRQPVVFNDYSHAPDRRGLPQGHSEVHRLISVPVIDRGRVVMIVGVGNKASDYSDIDVQTLELLANEMWQIANRTRDEKQ
ncbi:MAG: GAF domain-containing protein, partial [Gammaproteobacteria bacterium]|nr:GAF domain-containing protein [Gammaproteobacteria bacterium]